MTTARWTPSSKSTSIDSITAVLPRRAMSMMSALPLGARRTRSPTLMVPAPVRTDSFTGWVAKGSHSPMPSHGSRSLISVPPQLANGAVELHHLVLRHVLGALEHGPGAGVGGAHLLLLRVGEGEDAEGEQLVDLARVEEVARALRGDLDVILEDDRRGEHGVVVAGLTDAHRPHPGVHTRRGRLRRVLGGIGERQPAAILDAEKNVGGDQRVAHGALTVAGTD